MRRLIGYDVLIATSSCNLFVLVARLLSRIFTFINLVFLVFLGELKRKQSTVNIASKETNNRSDISKRLIQCNSRYSVVHLYTRRAIFSIASGRTNLTFRLGERRRTESLLVVFFTYLTRKTYFLSEVKLGDFCQGLPSPFLFNS